MLSLYKLSKFVFRYLLPEKSRYPLARAIASLVCVFNPRRRRTIRDNLIPVVGAREADRLAPILLGNFLITAVDFFCPKRNLVREMVFDNWGVLGKTYRRTKKVMCVTAHLGNWEIGMSYVAQNGFSMAGVYAPYREDDVVNWILSHRQPEVEWIPAARGALEACRSALERGRVLGMAIDIPFAEKGRRVTLCGRTAYLPLGPWAIAVKSGATVIPAFILREKPGKYRGIFHEPIAPPPGSFRSQMEQMQNEYCRHLETYLRRYPEQWGVLQPFWAV